MHCYSYDASKMKFLPECVIFPGSTAEVAEILKLANRNRFPIYPRGAGTGMVGAALPRSGGVALVMTRFNRILEVDQENMIAVVEPGVITGEFQRHVAQYGLFYPPDPASLQFSTIGGNAAMCAGGPRAVKYGVTRDYVMGLQVVLPTGEITHTGTRTQKGVVGYDLTRLMVGSEGTLGVFTQLILKLIPAPESVRTLLAVFPLLENAAKAVSEIIRNRIIPSTLELMDQATVEVVEKYLKIGLPVDAEALLLIEVDGRDKILDEDAAAIAAICSACGASRVEAARSGNDRDRLWKARRSISPALGQIKPDKINEDVTVPRTQIPALIQFVQSLAEKYQLTIVSFGHAGDGNIHTNIMLDKSDGDEAERAVKAVEELFRAVLDLGGTLSGEHGVGIAKSPFIEMEIGTEGLQAMLKIKQALDPHNVLNPGKMFIPDRAFFKR
jgi:glycolate oxidase